MCTNILNVTSFSLVEVATTGFLQGRLQGFLLLKHSTAHCQPNDFLTSMTVWKLCFALLLLVVVALVSLSVCHILPLPLSLTIPWLCHVSLFLHPFHVSSCILVCISVIVFVCHFLLCPPWFISRFCSAVLLRCFRSTLTSCVYLSLQFFFSPWICVLSLSDIGP